MPMPNIHDRLAAAGLALALAACAPAAPHRSPAEVAAHAAVMAPSDPRLADLYAHACKACHAQPGSGAPMAGDREAWASRVGKGEAGLLTSVISGYKGMPAGGQCFSCNASDYRALIHFMADQPVN
jgi:cytochrome c5